MKDIQLINDMFIQLRTIVNKLSSRTNLSIKFVIPQTMPQTLNDTSVIYINNDTNQLIIYDNLKNEWVSFDINPLFFTDLLDIIKAGNNITLDIDNINKTITINSSGGALQVQSDWLQSDVTAVDFIKNKPLNVSVFINDANYLNTVSDNIVNLINTYTGNLIGVVNQQGVNNFIDALKVNINNTTLVLVVSGWVNKQQTLLVPGITLGTSIWVSPSPTFINVEEYSRCKMLAVSQDVGSITFECQELPTINININIAYDNK